MGHRGHRIESAEPFFYHPFVYQSKRWIIGGEDKHRKYADVWNSPDGIAWTKQRDGLPFGGRSGRQVVGLRGRLYLLGNDVWSSTDGLGWQKETAEILKGEEVFGYAALPFDGKIWLLGCNRSGRFSSGVLVSAVAHRARLYMTGGKYGGRPTTRTSVTIRTCGCLAGGLSSGDVFPHASLFFSLYRR